MLSMKDIATAKIVIELCNNPDLKKEILCAPGSDYDLNKGNHQDDNKSRWHEMLEKKAKKNLENLGLEKRLQEIITSIVFLVGRRMLLWAGYHEGTLGLSREYSVNFLKNSFFTPQGMIDNKMAAEELIKDESLNIKQKYKLACLYCFTDHIFVLFSRMTAEDKKYFYDAEKPFRIKQPEFVKFWSYYLMGDINKLLKGIKNLNQYRLEKAVRSGSKTAVEYCLEKTKLRMKRDAVVDAAMEAVRCRLSVKPNYDSNRFFIHKMYKQDDKSWVPSDYYVDILCFLLSKMGEDQQIEFFKKEVEAIETESEKLHRVFWCLTEGQVKINKKRKCYTVLKYFLNWPYQVYFMKSAKLMWEFLPEREYDVLLLRICDKIESFYGKIFNFNELLREFWSASPDRYKRHVYKNQEVTYYRRNTVVRVKTGVGLLIKLLTLKNFTYEDEKIIELILASATAEEKVNILSTEEWTTSCVKLMKEEKWETLDRYIRYFFLSKEEEGKFKRELSFRNKTQSVCIDFANNDNWTAAESFLKWSSLPNEEIKKLKVEMINSEYGWQSCVDPILWHKKVKAVDKFIRWCLPSDEEIKTFKKQLIFSNYGIDRCAYSVKFRQEHMIELINFCLSSEEEVRELKKRVAYGKGGSICNDLITDNEEVHNHQSYEKGGKWEEVEKFLTWCFSSEEEINDFKKNKLSKEYGEEIHFKLIESCQWEEAETFFAWLGLSVGETKELKKRTLFDYSQATEMFHDLMFSEDNETFNDYGNKQEAIELLLRWYLTDTAMVLEYKDKFYKYMYEDEDIDERENLSCLKVFDLMIEQRLRDLDDESTREKRKSETSSPNKRLCTINLDTIGEECGK